MPVPAPRRPSPARAGRGWRVGAPLAMLVLVIPAVFVLTSPTTRPGDIVGSPLKRALHNDRRLVERQVAAAAVGVGGDGGLTAGALRADQRFANLAGQQPHTGGREDGAGRGMKVRQEEERQAAAYLRQDLPGSGGVVGAGSGLTGAGAVKAAGGVGAVAGARGGVAGGSGRGNGSQPKLQGTGAGGKAAASSSGKRPGSKVGLQSKKAGPPPSPTYHWPPSPPSPPPPPPPAADPPPGTYKFVRPNCADRGEQCPLWKQYGECKGNPGYMYYNCGASCSVCNVTYLHWDEVSQKREIAPGVWMPSVGFGTAGLGDYTRDVVVAAIRAGYRGVDSAEAREWYREDLVGQGVWLSGVKREHMFVTSKLHPRYHGYWNTLAMHAQTLRDLRTDYIDLFLLHYPECWGSLCGGVNPEGSWQDSWAAMEELVHEGTVRAIGVSNFNIAQLMDLLTIAKIKPALVQSNSDPLRQDAEIQAWCRLHGIAYQGYSTLGGQWLGQYSGRNPVLLNPTINEIAARKQRTPAQVVLRWALQHHQLVVPRTTKLNRMTENLQVFDFDLSDADMQRLDGLDGTTPVFPQDSQQQQQQQWGQQH